MTTFAKVCLTEEDTKDPRRQGDASGPSVKRSASPFFPRYVTPSLTTFHRGCRGGELSHHLLAVTPGHVLL